MSIWEVERDFYDTRDEGAGNIATSRQRSRQAARGLRRLTHDSPRVLFGLVLGRLAICSVLRPRLRRRPRTLMSTTFGAVGGLAGAAMMEMLDAALGPRGSGRSEGGAPPHEPAVESAEAPPGPVRDGQQRGPGSIVHYVMAGTSGAIYGTLSARAPSVRAGRGLAYGSLLWLLGDELALAGLGLRSPCAPVRAHAHRLLAYLLYGATLEGLMRLVRPPLKMR